MPMTDEELRELVEVYRDTHCSAGPGENATETGIRAVLDRVVPVIEARARAAVLQEARVRLCDIVEERGGQSAVPSRIEEDFDEWAWPQIQAVHFTPPQQPASRSWTTAELRPTEPIGSEGPALHDRIHPTSGRLLHAAPILPERTEPDGAKLTEEERTELGCLLNDYACGDIGEKPFHELIERILAQREAARRVRT